VGRGQRRRAQHALESLAGEVGHAKIEFLNVGEASKRSKPGIGYPRFPQTEFDQAGMMHTLLAGVDLSENGQAMDAIREVGPGRHFLGCAHTQANFETAFYRSPLADNNSVEQWEAEGAKDMIVRANALWKKQLAEYEPPPLDPAVDEALVDYMNRRKASFPDSKY